MNLPNLPTDNLYKFIAIAGLAMAIGGFLSAAIVQEKNVDRLFTLHSEASVTAKEVSLLKDDLRFLGDTTTPEAKEKALVISEKLKPLEVELARLESGLERYSYERQVSSLLFDYFVQFASAGVVIMIVGFFLWYIKLQRYLDKIVKKEAGV